MTAFVHTLNSVLTRSDVEAAIRWQVSALEALREREGRLFCLGVGGGAANAAHAVNDFRKLCGIEAYAPMDGVAELTARANDDGWSSIFVNWLRVSHLTSRDALYVYSVGGGTLDVSACIHHAVESAHYADATILGVVGRAEGTTAQLAEGGVVVTRLKGELLTPVTETVQIAVLHMLVSDPRLKLKETKW